MVEAKTRQKTEALGGLEVEPGQVHKLKHVFLGTENHTQVTGKGNRKKVVMGMLGQYWRKEQTRKYKRTQNQLSVALQKKPR